MNRSPLLSRVLNPPERKPLRHAWERREGLDLTPFTFERPRVRPMSYRPSPDATLWEKIRARIF